MTQAELVSIQPGELRFPFELKKQISCSLRLLNNTDEQVAFKVKTTSPKKYCVRPNTGIVPPRGNVDITVTMQSQREAPPDMQCKDKFLVQTVSVPFGTNPAESPDLFNKESGNGISETKLRVVLTSPQPPATVEESPEEDGLSPPKLQNGNSGFHNASRDASQLEADYAKLNSELASLKKERDNAVQACQRLQQELATKASSLKEARGTSASQAAGFSLLVVLIVGILGIIIGYLINSS